MALAISIDMVNLHGRNACESWISCLAPPPYLNWNRPKEKSKLAEQSQRRKKMKCYLNLYQLQLGLLGRCVPPFSQQHVLIPLSKSGDGILHSATAVETEPVPPPIHRSKPSIKHVNSR